jgi:hypothetical protein
LPDVHVDVQQSEAPVQAAPTSRHCCAEHDPASQRLEQQSVFTEQATAGPLQNVGVVQTSLAQTPEQHGAPRVAEQALAAGMQVLPGPPPSVAEWTDPSEPPSSEFVGEWEQLHEAIAAQALTNAATRIARLIDTSFAWHRIRARD